MAEHDAERAGSEEEREPLPAEGAAVPDDGAGPQDGAAQQAAPGADGGRPEPSVDEDAAWQAIVAGYGEEPPDPAGAKPFRSIEDLALPEDDGSDVLDPDKGLGKKSVKPPEKPLGSSVVFAPGVIGPRDYEVPEPKDGDLDDSEEGTSSPGAAAAPGGRCHGEVRLARGRRRSGADADRGAAAVGHDLVADDGLRRRFPGRFRHAGGADER